MRKPFLTALSAVLCLNFSVCASAAVAEETAVESAVPATEISVADDFYSTEEGGLVPTYTDDTIEPSFTLSEKEYTGAIPEETFKVYPPDYIGGYEIVPATREDGTPIAKYLTMGDLYQAWFENEEYEYHYPDYVCGVWTETGDMSELVVAVTKDEAGEAGKQEILSLIENDASVKFTYQSYSYKELRQVQEEITPLMGDGTGIYGIGVNEMENRLEAYIDITKPNAEAVMWKFLEAYGDMLLFETGNGNIFDAATEDFISAAGGADTPAVTIAGEGYDIGGEIVPEIGGYDAGGIYATGINADGGYQDVPAVTIEELGITTTITPAPASEPDNRLWIFAVCAVAVVVLGAVILVAVSRARAKQTTAGVVAGGGRLTAGDTETIVKKSVEAPQRDILGAVMEEIEK